jgi:hypothetical protein
MVTILRVIPNELYDRLLESGQLANAFPQEQKKEAIEILVSNVPLALRGKAIEILQKLKASGNFGWTEGFEIVYRNKQVHGSDVRILIEHLVLQRPKLWREKGAEEFTHALKNIPVVLPHKSTSNNTVTPSLSFKWQQFESFRM